ncbi:MAG: cobaltochelatase subunit CobT [Rhodospirillaceae bacterium]|nr:MAG: cobaltochelatase subunit CobT [Rhodospirillaceae bacterium]
MKPPSPSSTERGPSKSELLKTVTTAAVKAVSGHPETIVAYATVPTNPHLPSDSATETRLPMPPVKLTRENIVRLRGAADALALKLRYHDAAVHARRMPTGKDALDAYNAMEQARVENLGARRLAGVGKNLGQALEQRLALEGCQMAHTLFQLQMGDALKVMIHDGGKVVELGPTASHVRDLFRAQFGDKLDGLFDDLATHMDDQRQSANILRKLIDALSLEKDDAQAEPEDEEENDDGDQTGAENQPEEGEAQDSTESAAEDDQAESTSAGHGEEVEDEGQQGETTDAQQEALEPGADASETPAKAGHNRRTDETRYKVFTTRFDQVVDADDLCDPEELIRLRLQLDRQLAHLQGVVSRLANRLQRKLMAQQLRTWEFDLEEGLLDAGRLARIVANPTHSLSFKREKETRFRDTVVSLLIDNSGSMRGRPITIAAMTADLLARTLERCGVKVEILGFTTSQWKGGQSRRLWTETGKPPTPGRLNDLRHIIYKSADMPWRRARKNLGLMLREGILKENIDGEALAWAHNRLASRPEQRLVLMVISDGAPVDDSTLSVNSGNYLEQHLREVIASIERSSSVQLLAIGIGHDVTRYYRRAVTLMDADELGGAVMTQLTDLFEEDMYERGVTTAPLVM